MSTVARIRLISLGCLLGAFLLLFQLNVTAPTPYLQVSFLSVGQGDAILIETPEGVQVLIDGGPDSAVLRELAKEMSFFDRTLDMVIGTHQDLDHVGGLVEVLAQYEVTALLLTEGEGASVAAKRFLADATTEGAEVTYARAGQMFTLGASTTLTILSPSDDTTNWDSNTGSIVVLLTYGEVSFLLTGDAPQGIEEYLVQLYGEQLEAEVLKLGHHGSNTSSAESFLQAVSPLYAVVSAGKSNRYGHPHPDVLERVDAATGARVLDTMSGSVSFLTDGSEVWVE